jgi:hypothetical protein
MSPKLVQVVGKRSQRCYSAMTTRRPRTTGYDGTIGRDIQCAVRAIQKGEGYRIDFADWIGACWLPWEPIDEVVYDNIWEATRAIEEWLRKEPT